ncbi:hypothetical protein [Ekhidna sp.]
MLKERIVLLIILLIAVFLRANAGSESDWIKAGDKALAAQDHEQSILLYSKAIEEKPEHALAYLKRAKAYQASGAFRKSAYDMQKAYQLDPVFFKSYLKTSKNYQFKN